ncbi:MAG: hypothetical protein CMH49_05895 [Myxococcales bacterium]|nr:hypothetical protein [Myxococcales bacterium]
MSDLNIGASPSETGPWLSNEKQRVLLVSAEPWARNVLSLISQCSEKNIEVTHAIDGAQGLYYMSQSIYSGSPFQLLVLTSPLAQIDVQGCIEALRAIERGLNRPPYPCLVCTADKTPPDFMARYPQTLHLRAPNSTQAASMVSAGILQVIYTLQTYQKSGEHIIQKDLQLNLTEESS